MNTAVARAEFIWQKRKRPLRRNPRASDRFLCKNTIMFSVSSLFLRCSDKLTILIEQAQHYFNRSPLSFQSEFTIYTRSGQLQYAAGGPGEGHRNGGVPQRKAGERYVKDGFDRFRRPESLECQAFRSAPACNGSSLKLDETWTAPESGHPGQRNG